MSKIQEAIDWFSRRKDMGLSDKCQKAEDTALSALQDQAEREKGCEYCDPEIMDGNPIFSRHIDGYIGNGKFCSNVEVGIKAHFCPMCGRDLRKPVKQ